MSAVSVLAVLGPLVYWSGVLAVLAAGLVAGIASARSPRTPLVLVSSVALALALVVVAAGHPHAGPALVALGPMLLALSAAGGSGASQWVLLHSSGPERRGEHGGIVVADAEERPTEVMRGGMVIGLFERAAATGAIIAGFPEAIAVIVAVKGVGRFTELSESSTRERFIIGTLVSLSFAAAAGAVFHLAAA